MQERFNVNVRRSCRLALLQPSVWYAKSDARDQSALRLRIRQNRDGPSTIRLPTRAAHASGEGWEIGKKRVYRLYRLEGLHLRMKVKRRKRISLQRGRPTPATGPNQNWSMDFSIVRPQTASSNWRRRTTRVYLSGLSRIHPRCSWPA